MPSKTSTKAVDTSKYPRVSASDIQRRPGALTRFMQAGAPVLITHYDAPVGILLPIDADLPNFNLPLLYEALKARWGQIAVRGTAGDFMPVARRKSRAKVAPKNGEEA